MSEVLAVCVCTFMRPKLLASCLRSLEVQAPCDSITYRFVVVDNDGNQSARNVVQRAALDVVYAVEPRRGIASVRNAALNIAIQLRADWIAFIDDDEVADRFWLRELMSPTYRTIPILRGLRVLRMPHPPPFWSMVKSKKDPVEGANCHTAYTHNVRFSRQLIDNGLRFDEALGLTGGEDVDFFTKAKKAGFDIRQTASALTFETVHRERLTFWRQCHGAYWIAAANMRESILRRGLATTLLTKIHTIPLNLALGPVVLILSPLALPLGLRFFKKAALFGADKISRALGRIATLVGHKPAPYKCVDGE